MTQTEQFTNLIAPLGVYLGNIDMLSELGTLSLIALMVWLGVRRLRRHLAGSSGWHQSLSASDWNRLILPALLLPLLLIGRTLLATWQPVHVFNLAVPLLVAFLAIQSCFFVLRRVLNPTRALHAVERLISWLIWGVFALHLTGYLNDVIQALNTIGIHIGKQHITLYSVLAGVITLVATLIFALWLAKVLEHRLIGSMPLTGNMRLALTKLARSVLIVLAILITLPMVGIDITVLSIFGGAFGVGLGLGLQKIAANYVSGFTLLLDQSVRIGDMIEVNQHQGIIKEIATRYTVIRSLNGTESIIPNETMITSPVINRSLTDNDNLVLLPIRVAYSTNLEQVRGLLLEIASAHSRVLKTPEPKVRLKNFGESGIDLELAFWIADPEAGEWGLRSDINWSIWDGFQRENIEIPYPQRVIHQA